MPELRVSGIARQVSRVDDDHGGRQPRPGTPATVGIDWGALRCPLRAPTERKLRDVDSALAGTLVGAVLDGRYRVEAVLAHGGMSTVFTGTDLRLRRPVAIKVMSPSFAEDPVFVERFTEEARTAAALSHVNIVSVHDQGEDGGRVFLVMELVRGRTLRQLLHDQGRLSPELAVSIMEAVLSALGAAHRAGLVHRDVKPENVLISDDGLVKVADFGLARAVASTTSTQTGTVMGTAAYVAPEQVTKGVTDARADVYAAGIVLYEMLTGSPPYTGDSVVSVAYRHVHDDVPAPSERVEGLPPALDHLVRQATRRDPTDRPANAAAFLAALHEVRSELGMRPAAVPRANGTRPSKPARPHHTRALGDLPPMEEEPPPPFVVRGLPRDPRTVRPPVTPVYHDERRARRRRGLIGLLVVILLAGAAAGTGWWFGAGRYTDVPTLRGLTKTDAISQARSYDLEVRPQVKEVFDDDVPTGEVAGTEPKSGKRVTRGTKITLLISKGPVPVEVPLTIGSSKDEATDALQKAGFDVKVTEGFSDDEDIGTVFRQSPAGGTAPRGSTVAITVSKGPQFVDVPFLFGKTVREATEELEDLGLKVKVAQVLSNDDPPDDVQVLGQSPSAGTTVDAGATVTLTVL